MATLFPRLLLATAMVATAFVSQVQAVDNVTTKDAPELTSVRAALKAKKYDVALAELKPMLVVYQHPDIYNLMGFALRKTGDQKQAMTFYRKALDFDPAHKGALEYQGELYVELGQIDKARENEARLVRLCPAGCEELEDLREAIQHAAKGS